MSTHTPGPWRYSNDAGSGGHIYGPIPFKANCGEFVLKDSEQPIWNVDYKRFTISYDVWIQFKPQEWADMQNANGRLIAAAPDLLSACRAALAELDARGASMVLLDQLTAAIDRAEGREP